LPAGKFHFSPPYRFTSLDHLVGAAMREGHYERQLKHLALDYCNLYFVTLGVPVARILRRMGLSRWWVLVGFLPVLNLLGLWLLAFVRWPGRDRE
jgi:hypothetical protein